MTKLRFLALLMAGSLAACSVLDVSDPTAILDEELNDSQSADLLRRDVVLALYSAAGNAVWETGLFADEFIAQPPAFYEQYGITSIDDLFDRRRSDEFFSMNSYVRWKEIWGRKTDAAKTKLLAYGMPGAREAGVGEMFAIRGFAAMQLGENYCPSFPLHETNNFKTTYGPPLTTEQVFEKALEQLDSAVTWAADSARVLNFAKVARGRTLLNLGRYADAASAVTGVPDNYTYAAQFSATIQPQNPLATQFTYWWGVERSISDREGGVGLDFISAHDPRLVADSMGIARDSTTVLYGTHKYPTASTPIIIASGTEARLIEAEAALNTGDLATWLTKLNQLRATVGLSDTTDPGTADARVDLTLRERGFWLFGTAHRLGDLRRLINVYGRSVSSVMATGAYWRGGVYGIGTSLPMDPTEKQFSAGVSGCAPY